MMIKLSLTWPDRYFSTGAFIACSKSTCRKKRGYSLVPITQVVLNASESTEGVEYFDLKVMQQLPVPQERC